MRTMTMMTVGLAAAMSGGVFGCSEASAPGAATELASNQAQEDVATGEATDGLEALITASPTPSDVYIESITTGGTGCPDPSTVSTLISSDRRSFLVIFDQMELDYPPAPYVQNISCVAGVRLHIPNGWQFSVATVTTRGYAFLSPGIKARQTSDYFFAGNPIGAAYHSTLVGPFDDLYSFTDDVGFGSTVWSPCGGSAIFAINTMLNLNALGNKNGTTVFNTDTVDGAFRKVVHWQWQPC
jgi:hypothetical protein